MKGEKETDKYEKKPRARRKRPAQKTRAGKSDSIRKKIPGTSNKPSLVEVVVDPYEPPMPPKVTVKEALHFAEALAKGEPRGGRIALTLFRGKLNELL